MFAQFDGPSVVDARSRTIASRDEDRQRIAEHTEEFLKNGGTINVIEGYVAPVRAKSVHRHDSVIRGSRNSIASKKFRDGKGDV